MTPEQKTQLKAGIGKAIGLVPGKSEASLLLCLEDNCSLYLRGENDRPIGYITAAIFANEGHSGYPAFSEALAALYQTVLSIAPQDLFIQYSDIPAWSVGGHYIDRRMLR